jgi:hypothetical protein
LASADGEESGEDEYEEDPYDFADAICSSEESKKLIGHTVLTNNHEGGRGGGKEPKLKAEGLVCVSRGNNGRRSSQWSGGDTSVG